MPAIVLGLILALGIILVFVGLASSSRGSGISARLERYTAEKPEAPTSEADSQSVGLGNILAQSVALARLNKIVEQRDFGANLAREIARADLKLKVSEYLVIWASAIVGIPFLFLALSLVIQPLK